MIVGYKKRWLDRKRDRKERRKERDETREGSVKSIPNGYQSILVLVGTCACVGYGFMIL